MTECALQVVWNEDLFGPLNDTSVVLAIQVHDRIKYLRWGLVQ